MKESIENSKPRIDYMDGDPRSEAGFNSAVDRGVAIPKGTVTVVNPGLAPHVAAKDMELASRCPNSS